MNIVDELENAERFQRLFVSPLVDAVRVEIRPLAKGHMDLQKRVARLETLFGRAVWGLSVAAAVSSVVFGLALEWVKKKLGLGHH